MDIFIVVEFGAEFLFDAPCCIRSSVRIRKVFDTGPQIPTSELWIRILIRLRMLPNLF